MGETREEIRTTREEIVDIVCDVCGRSCMVDEFTIDNESRPDHGETARVFEYMKLSADWGYHTAKDGEKWEASICESCVDEKFKAVTFTKSV